LSSDFKAGASYVGSAAGATTVSLPLLNKGNSGFTTWFSVQNAGTAPANVTINYSDGTTASVTNLAVGAAKVFYQKDETHSVTNFAGTITSNQPVVAAVLQENSAIIFAYTGFTGGSTNPVFPLVNSNNAGFVTGLQVQNAGSQATDVTMSYTPSTAGTACTETQNIAPGAAKTFALAAFANGANSNCAAGVKFVGSAQVTANSANQPLVGIGNQLGAGNGGAYGAFDPAAATSKLVMPLMMDRNSGFFTGFNVQNVGSVAATVNCVFTNATYTKSQLLQPGEAMTDLQINKIADKYVGGATCTADNASAKILAIVNELSTTADPVDLFFVYEGAVSQ
jgi:hypothetical protein